MTVAPASLEANLHEVSGRGFVAVDAYRILEGCEGEVEITVPVEISECGPVADAVEVKAPVRGDRLKTKVSQVAKGEIGIPFGRCFSPESNLLLVRLQGIGPSHQIRIDLVMGHAVRSEEIDEAVVVEVGELERPSPIRAGQSSKEGSLQETTSASVDVKGVAHVLGGARGGEEPAVLFHVPHAHLGLVVIGASHVGAH